MDPSKACNKHTGPPFPLASPKTEMHTPTELAVTAGGDNKSQEVASEQRRHAVHSRVLKT